MFRDARVFLRQFFKQYHTTGSILPSSGALAKALCRYVDCDRAEPAGNGRDRSSDLAPSPTTGSQPSHGRRILEVGPGTGAVTARLVTKLQPGDQLMLVELNDDFVRHLQQRFTSEPGFIAAADRTKIEHCRLEDLPGEHCYDLIISGLPLNNFEVAEVEQILEIFRRLLKPGGTLSFFQYIAIRRVKALVTSGSGRARLRGIGRALDQILMGQEIRRDWVWPNVPPAWVHHVRMGDVNDKR